jgi:hypothetical protein
MWDRDKMLVAQLKLEERKLEKTKEYELPDINQCTASCC